MEKTTTITLKLIVSFFLISLMIFVSLYLYLVLVKISFIGSHINYNRMALLTSFLFYIRILPAILVVSLHIAFSGYVDLASKTIFFISVRPLLFSLFIIMMYAFYISYFITGIYNQINIELTKIEFVRLVDYRTKLKNEAISKAREALKVNNVDDAYIYLSDARFYSPNDNEINLILKNINHDRIERDEKREKNLILNIDKYLNTAIEVFTQKKYKEAYKLFANILTIEPDNRLAIYYLNKINSLDSSLPTYKGNEIINIYVYDKLSDAILDYERGNLWSAYKKINELYKLKPSDIEIKTYYDLIIEEIRKENFFIEDAQKIKDMYIDREIDNRLGSKNGFNILTAENTIMNVGGAVYYNEQLYMFDISIVHINQNIQDAKITRFKYGKMLNENHNKKTFVLKAKYNDDKNTFSMNNEISDTNISVIMSDNTLFNIRTKRYFNPELSSIYGLYKLRTELPALGYNLYKLDNEIIKKILDVLYLIALSMIVIFYSFKYRTRKNKRKHIFHSFIGTFGLLFVLYLIQTEFLKVVDYLVPLMNSKLVITIMALPALILFIVYISKFFSMKTDV